LYAVALRFPFTGTKGLDRTIKNSLPNFRALCIRAGSVLLASAKPRFVYWPVRWGSVIHHSRECVSTAPMVFTPLQLTLGIAHGDLVCGCLAMETHFIKLPTNSYCADVASRGSLELGSECCNRGQTIFTHYALQCSRSVSLCGLPLCGRAIIAPRRFHFTITALTVDRRSCSRAEILSDLLERWHPMTGPV
jgi:hypothetical protein